MKPLHLGASPATCRDVVHVQPRESTQGITIFKTTPSGGEATFTPSSGPAPQVLGFHPKKVTRERRRSESSTTAPRRRATSADAAPSAFARGNPTSAPSRCQTRMGEPQRRQHANPLAQAPPARRRRHHHARPPTSLPAEADGPDRPSPPRPDLKPRDAVASRQPRAGGSPSPERTRTPRRAAATPAGDAEGESPTTTGSRRQPGPPRALHQALHGALHPHRQHHPSATRRTPPP